MNSISRFLPSVNQGSFLANQWLRIQHSPLAARIMLAVAGIFAGAALAYACFKGIQALYNRLPAPAGRIPPLQEDFRTLRVPYIQNGNRVYLTVQQCEAALAVPNAKWVQVQCPYGSWDDVAPENLINPTFALSVVTAEHEADPSLPHPQIFPDGQTCTAAGISDFQDVTFEWQEIEILRNILPPAP